jgi:hypothetical protein
MFDKKSYLKERAKLAMFDELKKIAQIGDEDEEGMDEALNDAAEMIATNIMNQDPQKGVYQALMPTMTVLPQDGELPDINAIAPFDPAYYDDPVQPDLGGETWGLGGSQLGEY